MSSPSSRSSWRSTESPPPPSPSQYTFGNEDEFYNSNNDDDGWSQIDVYNPDEDDYYNASDEDNYDDDDEYYNFQLIDYELKKFPGEKFLDITSKSHEKWLKSKYTDIHHENYLGRILYVIHKYILVTDPNEIASYATSIEDLYTFMGIDSRDEPFNFYYKCTVSEFFVFNEFALKCLLYDGDFGDVIDDIEQSLLDNGFKDFKRLHENSRDLVINSKYLCQFIICIRPVIGNRCLLGMLVNMFSIKSMLRFNKYFIVDTDGTISRKFTLPSE